MSANENPDPHASQSGGRAEEALGDGDAPGNTVEAVDADVEEVHRARKRRGMRALITDAVTTPEQNRRSREKQYAVLQGLRLPFILAAIATAWQNWWIVAAVLFVVSVPLPWIAVVLGNAQGEKRDPRSKNVYKPAVAREEQRLAAARRAELKPAESPRHLPDTIDQTRTDGRATGGDHD